MIHLGLKNSKAEHMNEIIEGLYLGDYVASQNKYMLQKAGITHILTVGSGLNPKFQDKFTYKLISELDIPSTNLKQHFPACHRFI